MKKDSELKRYRDVINGYKEKIEQLSKENVSNVRKTNNLNESLESLKIITKKLEVKLHDIEMENANSTSNFRNHNEQFTNNAPLETRRQDGYITKNTTGANIQTNANTYIKIAKEQALQITLQTVNITKCVDGEIQ